MRRFWGWLGLNLGRRAGTVAIIGLLVTMALGIGIVKLRFTTSNSDYLNKNDPAWIDNVNYEKVFGGDPMAVMFTMDPGKNVGDLFTPHNQAEMQSIADRLAHDPWVFSAVTPLDAMKLSQALLSSPDGNILDSPAAKFLLSAEHRDPSAASRTQRVVYLTKEGTLESSFAPSQQVLSNPAWINFMTHEPWGSIRTAVSTFVPNSTHALMAIYLQGNLNINQEATAARSVLDILSIAHFQNATTITTGVPALLKTINDYLKHGITVLAIIAAIIMVSILALSFSVRWRLLAFAVVTVGMVWGFGLVGYFGIPLTLATIAALPVLLGVGMDYAIQMHSRIEEEVVLDRAAHPIQAAARGLGPALLVVTFDAVFAFMALWFAKTPAIREFGSLLVVGIVAVCVCSIIATLATLGIREYKSPTKGKDFSNGRMARLVAFLGSVPHTAAVPFAVLAIVVFLGGIAVEGKLHIQTDPIEWVNPHSQAIIDINALKAGTGSDNELAANIGTNDPFSNQTVAFVDKVSNELQARYPNYLYPAAGLVNTVDQFINSVKGTTHVDPLGSEIRELYDLAPLGVRRTTVANGGRSINVIIRGRTDLLSQLNPVVKDIQSNIAPPSGMTIAPGGIAVVGVGLIQNLEKSRVLLTYLALLFVGAFLALRLRSLIRSLLSLVPVMVAVGAVSLVAVALNLKLSPVTAVAGPLVVAVCTEFTSLILLRFVEERARGYSPRKAMDQTARRTGRAFLVSAMTAVAGIATLSTSSMPLLRDFGTIVAMNVTIALLSALVVLPPILVWAEQRNWVSRGLLRGEEPPFIEFARPEPVLVTAGGPSVAVAPTSPVTGEIHVQNFGAEAALDRILEPYAPSPRVENQPVAVAVPAATVDLPRTPDPEAVLTPQREAVFDPVFAGAPTAPSEPLFITLPGEGGDTLLWGSYPPGKEPLFLPTTDPALPPPPPSARFQVHETPLPPSSARAAHGPVDAPAAVPLFAEEAAAQAPASQLETRSAAPGRSERPPPLDEAVVAPPPPSVFELGADTATARDVPVRKRLGALLPRLGRRQNRNGNDRR